MRERTIEKFLTDICKDVGYKCIKLTPPPKGIPDRLIICPEGVSIFVELKAPTGTLSIAQQNYRDELKELKHMHAVVASKEDVLSLMNYLHVKIRERILCKN